MKRLYALALILPAILSIGCAESSTSAEAEAKEDHNIVATHDIEGVDLADYGNSIVGVVARIAHLEESLEDAQAEAEPLQEEVVALQARKTCFQRDGELCGACRSEISDTISQYEQLQHRIARLEREQEMLVDVRDRFGSGAMNALAQGSSTPLELLERDIRANAEGSTEDLQETPDNGE